MTCEKLQGHFCGFLLVLAIYTENGQSMVF